jgi:hypothetical protein
MTRNVVTWRVPNEALIATAILQRVVPSRDFESTVATQRRGLFEKPKHEPEFRGDEKVKGSADSPKVKEAENAADLRGDARRAKEGGAPVTGVELHDTKSTAGFQGE